MSGFKATGIFSLNRGAPVHLMKPSVLYQTLQEENLPPPEFEALEVMHSETQQEEDKPEAGAMEECMGSQEIAADLAVEQCPLVTHFYVDTDPTDSNLAEDISTAEPEVQSLESITRFLTLPSIAP